MLPSLAWLSGSLCRKSPKSLTTVTHHRDYRVGETTGGLSVLFTVLCIVDLFGVFPVITLPKSVITCGTIPALYEYVVNLMVTKCSTAHGHQQSKVDCRCVVAAEDCDVMPRMPVISGPDLTIKPEHSNASTTIWRQVIGVYGLPLVLSVFGLQIYTAVLLGRSWILAQQIMPRIKDKNRFPYAAVAELAFGPPAKRLVTFLIDAAIFGSGVPNFIIASQTLQIFWWKISGGQVTVTYCVWMVILALLLCPVMWLGSPKDMKPLAISSVLIVSTVAITTWTCIMRDEVSPAPVASIIALKPDLQDFLIAYGILAFQFDIHPMLLTLQVDMKDSRKINMALVGGFATTAFMFAVTTVLAAMRYGTDLNNNILQTIPASIPLYLMALLVTLQLCLSSAVSHSPLFQHIEDLLKVPRDFCFKRCLVRSSILALAIVLAEIVPRFDLVMGLVGSTLTGPLMFICPPLFFLKLCYMKSQLNAGIKQNGVKMTDTNQNGVSMADRHQNGDMLKIPLIPVAPQIKYNTFEFGVEMREEDEYSIRWYDVVLALVVMTIGAIATAVATYSSWSNSIAYATFSPPCLLNASAAARAFIQGPSTNL